MNILCKPYKIIKGPCFYLRKYFKARIERARKGTFILKNSDVSSLNCWQAAASSCDNANSKISTERSPKLIFLSEFASCILNVVLDSFSPSSSSISFFACFQKSDVASQIYEYGTQATQENQIGGNAMRCDVAQACLLLFNKSNYVIRLTIPLSFGTDSE